MQTESTELTATRDLPDSIEIVRVSATTVVGDRIAIVDVKAEDATAPLSAVMQFALDQLGGPASWPVWGESRPVAFAL